MLRCWMLVSASWGWQTSELRWSCKVSGTWDILSLEIPLKTWIRGGLSRFPMSCLQVSSGVHEITEPCETLAILRQLPSPSCEQVLASWCWDPVTMSGIEHYKDNFSTTSSFWGVDCLGDNLKFSTRFLYLTDNQWTPLYDASSRFGCCFLTVAGASW